MSQAEIGNKQPGEVTRQMRRAWVVLVLAFAVLLLLATGAAAAARYYYQHATQSEVAAVDVVSGAGALWRTGPGAEWTLIDENTRLREGDQVSTALGTVVWIRLFDGSTVEVSEDTVMTVVRMRSSRFLHRTKHVVLELARGTVYVGMAPHGDYSYSELTVRAPGVDTTMVDGRDHAGPGSFLVEARPPLASTGEHDNGRSVRAAALKGQLTVEVDGRSRRLSQNEQVIIDSDGSIGPVSSAIRELIRNGRFQAGLSGWVTIDDQAAADEKVASAVELVSDTVHGEEVVAVEFLRAPGSEIEDRTGVRQRIGQTLRVYSSMQLRFDVRIATQDPAGGGNDLSTFPFQVQLNYVDVNGDERQWRRGYYIVDNQRDPVPGERGSKLDKGEWQRIVFDLQNLSPLPKQITSIVLYASGYSYQTRVANISLTSSELDQAGS